MPMSNIELANYNQSMVPCKYCLSAVKRSKLPFHVSRCHKDELIKERAHGEEVEVQFSDTPSLVPERPVCYIVPNIDTENWVDSNYSTYNPLIATAHKPIIRGNYYHGFSKEEKRKCREFEIARMAQIRGRSPDNLETSHEPEVFVQILQPEPENSTSDESWSESSLSVYSAKSELSEESFNTCNSGGTNASIREKVNSFESSVAEYLRNLSDEKRAVVIKKFSKIMRDH